jgi:peptidylprolyl isomerase
MAMALSACGGGDSSATAGKSESNVIEPFEPEIKLPSSPPTKLVVRDIEEGSGPASKPGDELTVEYFSVNEHGKKRFSSQGGSNFEFELGKGDYWPGWEKGLEGMKVGGRREILMPPQLTANQGYLYYIVDLLKVDEPAPEAAEGSKG